jgi:hypothetical protein
MKRGFEENVPRVRPRVRLGMLEPQPGSEADEESSTSTSSEPPVTIAPVPVAQVAAAATSVHDAPARVAPVQVPPNVISAPPAAIVPESRLDSVAQMPVQRPAPSPIPVARASIPRPRAADAVNLAHELTSDLNRAAEVNAKLRAELDAALAALRTAAEESQQDRANRERIAVEAQSLVDAARRLEDDLQLVAGERDGALGQVARLAREVREEKLRSASAAEESRKARSEAAAAQEESRRLAAELCARAAEVEQARTAAEVTRAERDSLAAALLAARAEAEEAARSRSALEEIHRALEDARARVSRIR